RRGKALVAELACYTDDFGHRRAPIERELERLVTQRVAPGRLLGEGHELVALVAVERRDHLGGHFQHLVDPGAAEEPCAVAVRAALAALELVVARLDAVFGREPAEFLCLWL